MTSDARAAELIGDYFKREFPRVCPDATFAIGGPPAPRDEVFVHLEVWCSPARVIRVGWIYARCWVPAVLQVTATIAVHAAVREVLEGAEIPTDDGTVKIGEANRDDIGRDGLGGRWWMSALSFPLAFPLAPIAIGKGK